MKPQKNWIHSVNKRLDAMVRYIDQTREELIRYENQYNEKTEALRALVRENRRMKDTILILNRERKHL